MSVIKTENVPGSNLFPSAMASWFGKSSFDPYNLSSDDEEYLSPEYMDEMTTEGSNCSERLLTAGRVHLNSLPEARRTWGQLNPNLNDYNYDPIEFSSTFWVTNITNWWCQYEDTHKMYVKLSNVACDIFSTIPHGAGVEASFSLGRDVIGWRKSKTTGETLCEIVIEWQFAWVNHRTLAGSYTSTHSKGNENDLKLNQEAEKKTLHRMAKVQDFLEMWQGSQNICAAQKESHAQNEQMKPIWYISDTEEIINTSWSNFQQDGAAAFKLSERSPLPSTLSAKDHPGWRTQILNVSRMKWINRHPAEND